MLDPKAIDTSETESYRPKDLSVTTFNMQGGVLILRANPNPITITTTTITNTTLDNWSPQDDALLRASEDNPSRSDRESARILKAILSPDPFGMKDERSL